MKKFIAELAGGSVDYVVLMSTNGVRYLFLAADGVKQTQLLKEGLEKPVL